MTVSEISYERGSRYSPYVGRISLHMHDDERFEARYEHGERESSWRGTLRQGTFVRATEAMQTSGFPCVPPVGELAPGDAPIELAWCSDGIWVRCEMPTSETKFFGIRILTSSIIAALDERIARMPPGETTPVIDAQGLE